MANFREITRPHSIAWSFHKRNPEHLGNHLNFELNAYREIVIALYRLDKYSIDVEKRKFLLVYEFTIW